MQRCCIPVSQNNSFGSSSGCHQHLEDQTTSTPDNNTRCKVILSLSSTSSAQRNDSMPSSSMMVIETGPHGDHAMASQDIPAGSVIVQCLPLSHSLLVPPGSVMDDMEEESDNKRRRCARCFFQEGDVDVNDNSGRKEKFGRCSKCRRTFYCSRSCQAEDWTHHKMECQYYVKRRKQYANSFQFHATSAEEDAIPLLLRTFSSLKYMRDDNSQQTSCNDKEKHTTLCTDAIISCGPAHFSSLSVSSEFMEPSRSSSISSSDSPGMKLAKNLMQSFAVVGSSSTTDKNAAANYIWGYNNNKNCRHDEGNTYTLDQSIQRTLNSFQKNNFGIVNSLHAPIGEGVYPCAALLNHSCAPNCILRYQLGRREGINFLPPILEIVASRDILKGEELTHSYVDLALPTTERRARLCETHGFACECKRCNNKCSVELPVDRKAWSVFPLKKKFATMGDTSWRNFSSTLSEVDLDDAMTGCQGISQASQAMIHQQSKLLQKQARICMSNGDDDGELKCLSEAIQLYTKEGCISPFHADLYTIRCSYLSAFLANGMIHDAVEQCEHIVSFLAVAFSHVGNHPLLGLQLFTLGDLYNGESSGLGSCEARKSLQIKSKMAYTWAKEIMVTTHGPMDSMVIALEDNIAKMQG